MIDSDKIKNIAPKRFNKKVAYKNVDECWEWLAYRTKKGYGNFRYVKNGIVMNKAHRFVYEIAFGEFDLKLSVLHTCDNPSCVNPNHLWLGTYDDNNKDRHKKGRTVIPYHKGSANGKAVLNEDMVMEIKRRIAAKELFKDIAKSFGIVASTISLINSNLRWSHVQLK